jgi:hypothetical protein
MGVSDLNQKWPFAMATSKAGTAVCGHGRRWCIGVRTSCDGQIAAPVVVDRMIGVHRVHRPTINDNIRTKPVQLDEPLREVVAVLAQAQQNLLSPPRSVKVRVVGSPAGHGATVCMRERPFQRGGPSHAPLRTRHSHPRFEKKGRIGTARPSN